MTIQEKAILVIGLGLFAVVASWFAGQDEGLRRAEIINTKERLRVLCIDQPMNVVCLTVHKEK
jgi:hypothetical protein